MFRKSDLKKASSQLPIFMLYYYYLFVIINIDISVMIIDLLSLSNIYISLVDLDYYIYIIGVY